MTRDPFLCDGPTVVSFSGGRTSGLMLRRVLDAHGDTLPPDVHVVFANTGKERRETLFFVAECARQWGVAIHWIERDRSRPAGQRWREVTEATACTDGALFAELIEERSFLPNHSMRFCTTELKVHPMRDYMRAQTSERWTNVIGLRRDEPKRVMGIRARSNAWDTDCPLYDAGVTVGDVAAFWRAQPFDLGLQSWEGNCDACMLKATPFLARIERDRPGTLDWWIEQERLRGGSFVMERTYLQVLARAHAPVLPGIFDDQPALPCACTD
jgi:PP-loop superfamily ATP-utilizing enzyme